MGEEKSIWTLNNFDHSGHLRAWSTGKEVYARGGRGPQLGTIWEMGQGERTAGKERHGLQELLQLRILAAGTAPFTPGELGQQAMSGLGGRCGPAGWGAGLLCSPVCRPPSISVPSLSSYQHRQPLMAGVGPRRVAKGKQKVEGTGYDFKDQHTQARNLAGEYWLVHSLVEVPQACE